MCWYESLKKPIKSREPKQKIYCNVNIKELSLLKSLKELYIRCLAGFWIRLRYSLAVRLTAQQWIHTQLLVKAVGLFQLSSPKLQVLFFVIKKIPHLCKEIVSNKYYTKTSGWVSSCE